MHLEILTAGISQELLLLSFPRMQDSSYLVSSFVPINLFLSAEEWKLEA